MRAPLVAEDGGEIVATGVGTANGAVGWIGTIFVAPAWRGRGLGRAITPAIIDRLESAGCGTLVLVATREGSLLYERMGFEVQSRYRILEAPGTADTAPDGIRAFEPSDLADVIALDIQATGEYRVHALSRLVDPASTKIVVRDGGVAGYVVRPPWGGGATVAATLEDALAIIAARRAAAGLAGRVRVGVLEENTEGLQALTERGFVHSWSAPRMVRGAPMHWHPERIWGQFNHAMG